MEQIMNSSVVVEFRARIREVDGVKYVSVPKLTQSHVIQGDKATYTPTSLVLAAALLRLSQGARRVDSPMLEHVSGDFIGTFRVRLGTWGVVRAAQAARREAMGAAG
ncbi:hypothetical protein G7068_16285 [Leucobacter viscericola]|uniref:Uncharacterized protein n=1 Tax=Leucobacter viscericola TaxID=2714935 RepID=A0A6G7XJE0_9MICO|nr:hypothetical protein [Leucobacter viscericola]QIK64606.1 hypothetical protein G7068_16285 [Leucobacter viscericola]